MVDNSLVEYLRTYLDQGYELDSLREHLINYGYATAEVDDAIRQVSLKGQVPKAPKREKRPQSVFLLIAIVMVLLVVAAAALLMPILLNRSPKAPESLDMKLTAITKDMKPGDNFVFYIEISKAGSAAGSDKRYDVSLKHSLMYGGSVVSEKPESIIVSAKASKESFMAIPQDAQSGTYKLTTEAVYEDIDVERSLVFEVKPKTLSVTKVCPQSCDDDNDCTTDSCTPATNFECVHIASSPCCGNGECEYGETADSCIADCEDEAVDGTQPVPTPTPVLPPPEPQETLKDILDGAKDKSAASAEEAGAYCNSVKKDSYKDACFDTAAQTRKESQLCSYILVASKRDSCYISFALSGDDAVCELITNKNLKESCLHLVEKT